MNMIEKMARAICEAQALDPDMKCYDGDDGTWTLWEEFQTQAKASLECLKEPTDGMKQVVSANWGRRTWSDYQDVINAALEGK